MFPIDAQYTGRKLDKRYVTERAKWEPFYEATQIKGDGETHPFLSPNDEFADYENWDIGNLDLSEAKTDDMLAGEYAREGLKRGLALEAKLGTNPYKFGMVGSTDSHTSLATAQEDNFFGKHSGYEPNPKRMDHPLMKTDERHHRWAGSWWLRGWLRFGRKRTRAGRSSMPWSARKFTPRQAVVWPCVSSAVGTIRRTI